jgi:CheY-like chemotaxis protein
VAQALGLAATFEFDVLICDIGLPDGSGTHLLESLNRKKGRLLPAIAMSGFGMEQDRERASLRVSPNTSSNPLSSPTCKGPSQSSFGAEIQSGAKGAPMSDVEKLRRSGVKFHVCKFKLPELVRRCRARNPKFFALKLGNSAVKRTAVAR